MPPPPTRAGVTLVAAQRMAHDMVARLRTLPGLGLGSVSLGRRRPTLWPGVVLGVGLATQFGSGVFGVL